MADRDKLNWESEELRGQNLQLDMKLREFSSRAETEGAQRRQLENQVSTTSNVCVLGAGFVLHLMPLPTESYILSLLISNLTI